MHPELEQLLVLQDRQQKIRQIQTEIETVPLRRTSLEAQLAASASAVDALKQKAPEFTLSDQDGNDVSLSDLVGRSKAVALIFYRGFW